MKQHLTPSVFAVAAGATTTASEHQSLATARYQFHGARKIWAAPSSTIQNFLRSKGESATSLKAIHGFLGNLTPDSCREYAAFCKIGARGGDSKAGVHFAAAMANEVYVIPAGWSFYEVIGSADCVGAKQQMSSNSNSHLCQSPSTPSPKKSNNASNK